MVTGDKEIGSDRGVRPLISQAVVTGRWAVAAEPTDLDIYTGNRGRL